MADRKAQSSFADFVKDARSADEAAATVRLRGEVLRSATDGKFILATPDRGSFELDVEAVTAFDVVEDSASRKVAEVVIPAERIVDPKAVGADSKNVVTDFITDKSVLQDKRPWWDGGIPKPVLDPPVKVVADPPIDPSQVLFDPAVGTRAAAQGAVPFVMATPHHAPPQAIQAQLAAAGVAQAKQIAQEGVRTTEARTVLAKHVTTDPQVDVVQTLSLKDVATDPQTDAVQTLSFKDVATDPVVDVKPPLKEVHTDNIADVKFPIKDAVGDPKAPGSDTWVEGVEVPGGNLGDPRF